MTNLALKQTNKNTKVRKCANIINNSFTRNNFQYMYNNEEGLLGQGHELYVYIKVWKTIFLKITISVEYTDF